MNPHGRGPTGRLSLVDVGASEAESTVERTLARKDSNLFRLWQTNCFYSGGIVP